MCAAWRHAPTLVLCALDDTLLRVLSGLGPVPAVPRPREPGSCAPILEFAGKRHPIIKPLFVIGRAPTCDLVIRDGTISRRHASVIRNGRNWYIKDLESTVGISYEGMRIDNKRIDEGDVFHLAAYELRFTFER